jgi:hypothetical protein
LSSSSRDLSHSSHPAIGCSSYHPQYRVNDPFPVIEDSRYLSRSSVYSGLVVKTLGEPVLLSAPSRDSHFPPPRAIETRQSHPTFIVLLPHPCKIIKSIITAAMLVNCSFLSICCFLSLRSQLRRVSALHDNKHRPFVMLSI